jgi:hypothetical protein
MFELVELGKKCIDDLKQKEITLSKKIEDWTDIDGAHTRRPSDGSVPAIAPALAAVNDSTSSIDIINRIKRENDLT